MSTRDRLADIDARLQIIRREQVHMQAALGQLVGLGTTHARLLRDLAKSVQGEHSSPLAELIAEQRKLVRDLDRRLVVSGKQVGKQINKAAAQSYRPRPETRPLATVLAEALGEGSDTSVAALLESSESRVQMLDRARQRTDRLLDAVEDLRVSIDNLEQRCDVAVRRVAGHGDSSSSLGGTEKDGAAATTDSVAAPSRCCCGGHECGCRCCS